MMMMQAGECDNAEVLIVDPPRKGLEEEVLEALCEGSRTGTVESFKSGKRRRRRGGDDDDDYDDGDDYDDMEMYYASMKSIRQLIYVSCGFEALKRDAKALIEAGWKVTHAEGFVLFPGSDHLETLAVFERSTTTPPTT